MQTVSLALAIARRIQDIRRPRFSRDSQSAAVADIERMAANYLPDHGGYENRQRIDVTTRHPLDGYHINGSYVHYDATGFRNGRIYYQVTVSGSDRRDGFMLMCGCTDSDIDDPAFDVASFIQRTIGEYEQCLSRPINDPFEAGVRPLYG